MYLKIIQTLELDLLQSLRTVETAQYQVLYNVICRYLYVISMLSVVLSLLSVDNDVYRTILPYPHFGKIKQFCVFLLSQQYPPDERGRLASDSPEEYDHAKRIAENPAVRHPLVSHNTGFFFFYFFFFFPSRKDFFFILIVF